MARMTRSLFALSWFSIIWPRTLGTICHDTPNLSVSQPHCWIVPPAESLFHSVSISFCVRQLAMKETAGENVNCGPPLSARNS
jgi:hypothetical protein